MTRVLCVNLGSRTTKLVVLDVPETARAGEPGAPLFERDALLDDLRDADLLTGIDALSIEVVAYRIVRINGVVAHDAEPFDRALQAALVAAEELAPLHTRGVVAAAKALRDMLPHARHVAVFDAAFHRTIPDRAAAYGLPYADFRAGWRKVGFHGLSHAYAAARTAVLLGDARPVRKLVSAHLGGGASVAAIDGPASRDTTMGFTPVDGLMMATRTGALDPGLLLAYMRRNGLSIDATEDLLSNRSGLLGLGGSADMREIIAARDRGDQRARLAYEVFVYRLTAAIGAMTAALGGIGALAFLGGIGENAPAVRADACAGLGFLGVAIDPGRNADAAGDAILSPPGVAAPVLRIHAREDWMMALAAVAPGSQTR